MDFNAKQYPGLHIHFHPSGLLAVDKNSTGGGLVRGPRLSHSLMNQFPLTGGPGIDSFAGFFPGLYLELNI